MSKNKINSDIWPDERHIIESPHRLQYVRKIVKPKGCVFCKAAKDRISLESLVVFKSRSLMVVMNKYPYNNGHLLILPKRHIGDFEKLSQKELMGITGLAKESIKILKKVYKPQGFNMGMNLGSVAGAGIPDHLHYHVIPRWGGDTNFFPLIAQTKLVVETLEQSYNQLRPHFKNWRAKVSFKIELDHIGIATPEILKNNFFKILGLPDGGTEVVESEGVKVGFFQTANKASIELLEALNEESPIAKFIDKRGPGIHHICFRVQEIEKIVEHLKANGVRLINEEPKMGAHNCKVVFIHPKSTGGVLVELSEKVKS